jgi:cytochrome c oxidase assembly protein subunit 15
MTSAVDETVPAPGAGMRAQDRVIVRAWLLVVAALVFAIIVVGGATRLTESGLSITEWEVVTGILPPLSAEQWLVEFEKYRQIPQYLQVNRGMSLAAFQTIYLWEWGHRLLGRIIGIAFLIPFLVLLVLRRLDRALAWKLFGIGLLIGVQGVVGWWMVTSGLVDRIAVAPYRLATHLTLACVIFVALLWVALDLAPRREPPAEAPPAIERMALVLLVLVFLQIYVGGLVAGTRSGYVYQTWPLIDGWLWPGGMFVVEPWWRNLFENTGTTQFLHRTLAYLLTALALWHALAARRTVQDPLVRRRAMVVAAALLVQAAIGVATLLTGMHILVALAHQAWIVPVLAVLVVHRHALVRSASAHAAATGSAVRH